ncbi:MAG: hypothetical protein P8K05_01830 [Dehalococcoidia bacterium]|nr:hypothetical protein [Dehalococcoidia bacterium]
MFDLDKYYRLLGDFNLKSYLKLDPFDITYEFEANDYLEYKEKLTSKIQKIDLKDYKSLKEILELAGTMNFFLGVILNRITSESFFSEDKDAHLQIDRGKKILEKTDKGESLYDREKIEKRIKSLEETIERKLVFDADGVPINLYQNQIEDIIYKFTDIFEKKFLMLGLIYEFKGNILENIDINETYIINEFNELDFNQLEAFLKLYQY